jgi:hypothetical protein
MSNGGSKGWSWEQWALLITAIVAVITAAIAVWGVLDARENKDKLVESQHEIVKAIEAKDLAERQKAVADAAKDLAERRKVAAETKATELKAENARLTNVSIERLLAVYDGHLNAISKAASKYDDLSRLPNTPDTLPQKAAAERELFNEVASFEQFVSKWKDFAETLGKLLDGNVERMRQGRERHNPDDVKDALDVLRKSFPDLRQMLEVHLGQLASG